MSSMFKRAVSTHEAAQANKLAAQHMFSSSPLGSEMNPIALSPPNNGTLKNSSPNIVRQTGGSVTGYLNKPFRAPAFATTQHAGLKRSASGLTKTLSGVGNDGFEDSLYPDLSGSKAVQGNQTKKAKINSIAEPLFDEDDFDSDIDLEVEDLSSKAAVTYPEIPTKPSKPFLKASAPKLAAHTETRGARDLSPDSGYVSQTRQLPKFSPPKPSQITNSSAPLDWSSSPVRERSKPNLAQYAFDIVQDNGGGGQSFRPNSITDVEKKPAAEKLKRTLYWQKEDSEEQTKDEQNPATDATPVAKPGKTTPWNMTASALRDGQKKLREVNKHLSKVNSASTEEKTTTKTKKKGVAKVFLSEEQQHVLNLVTEQKKSVFFTGSAGTGKSVLLREVISALRRKYAKEPERVAVTASTGLAACNVGGVTLHSFAGFGLGKEEVPDLVKKIKRNMKAKQRWMRCRVLIIDEVSMVDAELFDKLEEIARNLRNNGRPFGGIQLVITGDFFQLPPVPDYGKRDAKFCFDANTWNTTIEHTIGLHHVFRQKDPVFAGMLNEMREGRLSTESINKFRSLSRNLSFDDDLEATELFPTRAEVERANQGRLTNLRGEVKTFEARDGGSIVDKAQRDKLLQNCMAPEKITLKKGAQVMLIKNVDETLVNGSLGKVIGFMSEAMFDNYQQHEEDFLPTQNKSVESDSPEGLKDRKMRIEELVASTTQYFPVVRFAIADGSTRDLLCQRENWKVELPNGEVQASRAQIPLILAWALSIHKAQGQTLERVKVDLGKVFEKGQAYVALSRATSMAGLQIMRFDPKKVLAHERVRVFYSKLSRAEEEQAASSKRKKSCKPHMKAVTMAANDYENQFLDDEYDGLEI